MIVLGPLLCLGLLVVILLYVGKINKFVIDFKELRKLPGPSSGSVIIGNMILLHTSREKIFETLRQWAQTYYPIYQIRALHVHGVCLLTPEDGELLLSNQKHIEKSVIYDMFKDWLGTGLLTSTGKKWLTRRRILTQAFHFSILQQFVGIFNEETDKLVESLKNVCHQAVIVDTHLMQFTLKTIAETAMGTKLSFNTKKQMAYKQAVLDVGQIIVYRLLHSWFINRFINIFSPKYLAERRSLKILHKFTRDVIAERQRTLQEADLPRDKHDECSGKRRLAMLDLLLTAKNEEQVIDDEGIREEVDTFMFEGHDTTAVALGFALMLIACNRNVQDQIVEEMEAVLGDRQKKPTYNDIQEMKYLERAVKEVLRMYPSVHFISRKLGEDLITSSGYKLPEGSTVHLHIYDLHHNPDIYPDPEKFDPDRFLPENCRGRHPFAFLPFSAGPRNCIGQRFAMLELKAAICGILASFVLEPVDTPSSIVLVVDIVLRAKDGIKVKFVPRA